MEKECGEAQMDGERMRRSTDGWRKNAQKHRWMEKECTEAHLDEPDSAVASDNPVRQQPHQRKVHLTEEEEQRKNSHDVHVHAMDLHDPQACGMRVLDAARLVVLKKIDDTVSERE